MVDIQLVQILEHFLLAFLGTYISFIKQELLFGVWLIEYFEPTVIFTA